MAEAQTLPDYPRGLDFQQVWAALMENREQIKETDRIVKENAKQQEKTDLQMKETDKQLGKLGNRFGTMS